MRRNIEKARRKFLKTPKLLILTAFMFFMFGTLVPVTAACDMVTVTDNKGNNHVMMTSTSTPEEILEQTNFTKVSIDGISYPQMQEEPKQSTVNLNTLEVNNRLYNIDIHCDGEVLTHSTVTGTVADMLERSGIELNEHDYVLPAPNTNIENDMKVEVKRVEFISEELRSDVSDEKIEEYHSLLLENNPDAVFKPNRSGIYDVKYTHRLENGELVESEISELIPIITPNDPANSEFVKGEACSSIDHFEGVEFDENGLPANYSKKISSASTTAYSSRGGKGSSGLGLFCGTVAVNPNVIPYGSKLYIVSPDGNFVYGFAIATDTGTALVEGKVDIDLYFESNAECNRFGKRSMDVYVLE